MQVKDRQKRIEEMSFYHRLNLKLFCRYLRIYFYFDSFTSRGFSSYTYDNAVLPPVRIVNKVDEANVIVLHDCIKQCEREQILEQYNKLQEPKFVVLLTHGSEGSKLVTEESFIEISKLLPVDLKISQYVGHSELLTSFQGLVRQVVS